MSLPRHNSSLLLAVCMLSRFARSRPQVWAGLLACGLVFLGPAIPAHAAEPVDYVRDIKPLLARCTACHGALRQKNGLRLDTADLAKKGGDGGPAIEPGQSAQSLLIDALTGANNVPRMPPEGEGEQFTPAQIELLQRWIDEGAQAPAEEIPADPRRHWSYTPPVKAPLPQPADPAWKHNPIDAFVAVELERHGLTAAPLADRGTLLRRVSIDLTGLPPTREELLDFLNDARPDAYERVVDRLLQSPRYAERWGRHWMDIWRYSDWYGSRGGNELRNSRRHIWRWRDWIVESIEADKGYDQMVVEMLAPDELAPGNLDLQRAGGFLGRNYYVFNRHVWLQDAVEYTSMALLGVTFKCARCHDHKYDPLSQEEYYRFKAFFEPYQVRTDPIAGQPGKLTGNQPAMAPPGATLAHGHDIVYDAQPDVPTYLLQRGNEKDPVTDRPLAPGVPAVLSPATPTIAPISLPVEAYYPELRAEFRQQVLADARQAEEQAAGAIRQAAADVEAARARLVQIETDGPQPNARSGGEPFLVEPFTQARADVWQVLSGDWQYENGHLVQKQIGSFVTMLTKTPHPADFQARIRYKTLEPGGVHSVGYSFDVSENAHDWQAVYTATNNTVSNVQAFHRVAGVESYPAIGIIPYPFKLNDVLTVDLAVRGDLLNVWVNGELKIAYKLPVARQPGRFALWAHSATAEFYELKIEPISPEVRLVSDSKSPTPSPFGVVTKADVEQLVATLQAQDGSRQQALELAKLERLSIEARVAAEVAKHASPPAADAPALALAAGKAERELAAFKARQAVPPAEQAVTAAQAALTPKPDDEAAKKAVADAEAKLAAARTASDAATAAAAKDDPTYTPLGTVYPQTTSGRRLALARWIVDRNNPLSARVAVNHMWLRHFGTALVPSVFNFGLNGKRPTHPELLDWLAVEFMERGWSTRAMHRLMVTSRTYQLQSQEAGPDDPNLARDPENRWYWRANPRRMEAEVVRDGLLHLAGRLDVSRHGPDLEPAAADLTPRRSLYFRHTPDDRALLLELFDAANASECYQRDESIVPQQALALANGVFAQEQARLVTSKLLSAADLPAGDAGGFITRAFEHVLSRSPTEAERALCGKYLAEQAARYAGAAGLKKVATGPAAQVKPAADPALRARESLVHVLLNYNEFVVVR